MSWWLLIPMAWIATGANLILAENLSWHGYAPDFLLLLLSFVIVRPAVSRRFSQAVCVGLLMDFSGTGIPGIQITSTVLTVAILSRWIRTESDEPASWLVWAFLTMSLCAGVTLTIRGLVSKVPIFSFEHAIAIPLSCAVTMAWGVLILTIWLMFKRLTNGKDRGFEREPNSLSFFLSR